MVYPYLNKNMGMVKGLILIGLLLLFFIGVSYGQSIEIIKGSAVIAWDPVTTDINGNTITIDYYELILIRDGTAEEYKYGTPNTQLSIPKPKSGIFVVWIRCIRLDNEGIPVGSQYCSSVIPECTNNNPFKLRWKPSSILGPIIIK